MRRKRKSPPPPDGKYWSVPECAEFYRVSEAAIWLHLTRGNLRRCKFGGKTLILREQAESFLKS